MLSGCVSEIASGAEFRSDYLEAAFSIALLELLKIFEVKREAGFIGDEVLQNPEKLCENIKHYIDTHLFSIGSLTEISDLCGYNYSYLSFLFRKITGITLSDYYKARRFESAKLMLIENRLKIGEISNLLGYNSVYAFSKAFKDEFGVSPKNYHKNPFETV
jgi:AraC-like DNA-binding protein